MSYLHPPPEPQSGGAIEEIQEEVEQRPCFLFLYFLVKVGEKKEEGKVEVPVYAFSNKS